MNVNYLKPIEPLLKGKKNKTKFIKIINSIYYCSAYL